MKSDNSKQMYHDFLERLKKAYTADKIKGKNTKDLLHLTESYKVFQYQLLLSYDDLVYIVQ